MDDNILNAPGTSRRAAAAEKRRLADYWEQRMYQDLSRATVPVRGPVWCVNSLQLRFSAAVDSTVASFQTATHNLKRTLGLA